MNWHHPSSKSARLHGPADGIYSCTRKLGPIAKQWLSVLDELPENFAARTVRGRNYARRGRVRNVWFSPGLVTAEVLGSETHQVSLRIQTYDKAQWTQLTSFLTHHLELLSGLLEGHLPSEFLEHGKTIGLPLFTSHRDVEGDCDCNDYLNPCLHILALQHIIADALEGDPFILLTLRGQTRHQVLRNLRMAWGDANPIRPPTTSQEEIPRETNWFRSPRSFPNIHFSFEHITKDEIGIQSLGSAPGQVDLLTTLEPLYDAGAEAALEIALSPPPSPEHIDEVLFTQSTPRTFSSLQQAHTQTHGTGIVPSPHTAIQGNRKTKPNLTELLVNTLAKQESATTKQLVNWTAFEPQRIRQELLELEKLGLIYRTGRTRSTRWWLG